MIHSPRKPKGAMLLFTLVLLAILWFVVLSFSRASLDSLRLAAAQVSSERAITAAESGLVYTIELLKEDPEYRPDKQRVKMKHSPESFAVEILEGAAAPPDLPDDSLYLRSTGFDSTGRARQAVAVVKVGSSGAGLFDYGLFASGLQVKGGSNVLPFDSSGTVGDLNGHALVGTNSTKKGDIKLYSGARVDGLVYVGPGGETKDTPANPWEPTWGTDNVVWKNWNATTQGEENLSSTIDYPKVEAPEAGNEKLKVGWKGADIEPGAYRELQADGGGEVRLSPGTYVFDSIKLSGGAQIRIEGDEQVLIYVKKKLDISNGSFFNAERKAKNLAFMVEEKGQVDIRGGSNAYFVVYAPGSKVQIKGGNSVYGAIVGDDVQIEGGSNFYFDLALKENPPSLPGIQIEGGGGTGGGGVTVYGWQRF